MTQDVENLIENAKFLKKSGQLNYLDYERFKKKIALIGLEPKQYDDAIRRLCEVMKL